MVKKGNTLERALDFYVGMYGRHIKKNSSTGLVLDLIELASISVWAGVGKDLICNTLFSVRHCADLKDKQRVLDVKYIPIQVDITPM